MSNEIKSGKDVIDEFFSEILKVEDADKKTVEKLIELYRENKLTDSNIQNVLEDMKQQALNKNSKKDGKD